MNVVEYVIYDTSGIELCRCYSYEEAEMTALDFGLLDYTIRERTNYNRRYDK